MIVTQYQDQLEQRKERLERKLGYAIQSVMYMKGELRKLDSRIELFKFKQELRDKNFKQQYLEKHIFKDLTNLNDGFDVANIKYFSGDDFEVVLNRVKEKGLGIYGIEPRNNGEYFDLDTFENYQTYPQNPDWYFNSFRKFNSMNNNLQYSASYYVPGNAFL